MTSVYKMDRLPRGSLQRGWAAAFVRFHVCGFRFGVTRQPGPVDTATASVQENI